MYDALPSSSILTDGNERTIVFFTFDTHSKKNMFCYFRHNILQFVVGVLFIECRPNVVYFLFFWVARILTNRLPRI